MTSIRYGLTRSVDAQGATTLVACVCCKGRDYEQPEEADSVSRVAVVEVFPGETAGHDLAAYLRKLADLIEAGGLEPGEGQEL